MSVYFSQNTTITKFNTKDSWIILNPIEKSIKEKIERIGTPLKDWDIKINYGIKTGFNEAFIIDGITKDRLIAEDPKSAEIIRPILRGRDIKRYTYDFADLWIITTFPSLKLNIEDYPAIKQHLLSFGYDRLKQTGDKGARKKTNNKWFEVQDTIAYWEDFYKQKIVWNRITETIQFSYTDEDKFILDSSFFMSGCPVFYFLGILNSKLIRFYINKTAANLGDGVYGAKIYIEQIPIPKYELNDEHFEDIEKVTQEIIKNKKIEINELNLNSQIYKLYNLNQQEIDYIQYNF